MMTDLILGGCTPTPLASYLKALAVLRLVAEQGADSDATAFWRDDQFVLHTSLSKRDLVSFFLKEYNPTPLVAPWNGGSGFFYQERKLEERDAITGKKLKTGIRDQPTGATRTIEAIAISHARRLADYRAAVAVSRQAIARYKLTKAPENRPGDAEKDAFIQYFRNVASDSTLRWMDASLILAEGAPEFPPLLGTGGNDGNLDFTNNFMQRIGDVFDIANGEAKAEAAPLLDSALFGSAISSLVDRAIGQFSPGSAGGPNASVGFDGSARINPWDFILMLEGAVLFAASAARRLESSGGAVLSAPFTVRSRAGTVGAAAQTDDGDARGEIWMPLWSAPFSFEEMVALFREGRAALGTRPVRDGLDFARAVARLGVDRGLTGFQRYGLLMRSGKAFLATPLSRVAVQRNPDADLINDLEQRNWLGSVQAHGRQKDASNALSAAAAQLDAALFALTQRADRAAIQAVLQRAARIEALCAHNSKAREAIRHPLPTLSAGWAYKADDGSPEFRIAAALAGLQLRAEGKHTELTMRPHLVSVSLDGHEWDSSSHLVCWGTGRIEFNLARVLHRRRLESVRLGCEGELLRSQVGATFWEVQTFLDRATDDTRIAELLVGLACTDLSALGRANSQADSRWVPVYALLKVLFTPESWLRSLKWLPADRNLHLPAEIPARLSSGDVDAAVHLAWQRLRAIGAALPGRVPPRALGLEGPRLLAALMIPLTYAETANLLRQLAITPDRTSESTGEMIENNA